MFKDIEAYLDVCGPIPRIVEDSYCMDWGAGEVEVPLQKEIRGLCYRWRDTGRREGNTAYSGYSLFLFRYSIERPDTIGVRQVESVVRLRVD